jgi:hypothetical protein
VFLEAECVVSIGVPTGSETFQTSQSVIIVGRSASGVSFIRIRNVETGFGDWTYVNYGAPGVGHWAFHDGVGLVEGTNRLVVSAHRNGIHQEACNQDSIVVTRIPAS